MTTQTTAVRDIKKGDVFTDGHTQVWTAAVDAVTCSDGSVILDVQFVADGGFASRAWDDGSHALTVQRS